MVHNTWVLNALDDLARSGRIRSLSRIGFIDRGRGAVWVELSDGKHGTTYLSRSAWHKANLNESLRTAILNAIDTYTPLNQAVVVAFSSLEHQVQVTTCLVKF